MNPFPYPMSLSINSSVYRKLCVLHECFYKYESEGLKTFRREEGSGNHRQTKGIGESRKIDLYYQSNMKPLNTDLVSELSIHKIKEQKD